MAKQAAKAIWGPGLVLVVDDDATNLFVLSELLSAESVPVLSARSGPEAVALARERHPAVVLMDLSMPQMDGYEAARAIIAELPDNPPPVFAVTAHVTREFRERAQAEGFAGFFEKPIDIERILDGIRPHLV